MLMALPFVGGLMNLAWIGAIALFVLFEENWPLGRLDGPGSGGLGRGQPDPAAYGIRQGRIVTECGNYPPGIQIVEITLQKIT